MLTCFPTYVRFAPKAVLRTSGFSHGPKKHVTVQQSFDVFVDKYLFCTGPNLQPTKHQRSDHQTGYPRTRVDGPGWRAVIEVSLVRPSPFSAYRPRGFRPGRSRTIPTKSLGGVRNPGNALRARLQLRSGLAPSVRAFYALDAAWQ
jgi:hypothetical protein